MTPRTCKELFDLCWKRGVTRTTMAGQARVWFIDDNFDVELAFSLSWEECDALRKLEWLGCEEKEALELKKITDALKPIMEPFFRKEGK